MYADLLPPCSSCTANALSAGKLICVCWGRAAAVCAALVLLQVCQPVSAVAMSESPDSTSQAEESPLDIEINNDVGKDYTLIKVRHTHTLCCMESRCMWCILPASSSWHVLLGSVAAAS